MVETPVNSVQINSAGETNEILCGNTLQLSATVLPANATSPYVNWSVSDESILSVDQNGLVTAVYPGEAYVYAESHGVTDAFLIVVKPILIERIVIPENLILESGTQYEFKPEIYPENATIKQLVWTESDPSVGMMLSPMSNIFCANGIGQVTLTCTATDGSDVFATCFVDVRKRVQSVVLNEHDLTLKENSSIQLIATIQPIDATVKTILWSSSNDCVEVDNNGLIEAKYEGEAIVYAISEDNILAQDECKVTVKKDDSGISDIAIDELNVHIEANSIVIENLPLNQNVLLYNLKGILLEKANGFGSSLSISVEPKTPYILVVGKYALKVMTK